MPHSRHRARAVCLALGAGLVIAGCGVGDRGEDWVDDGWRYAMGQHLYYRPDAVSTDVALIQARLPAIEASEGVWLEAQRTPPETREVIPAPDDYVWHTVAVVGPSTVQTLLTEHSANPITGDPVLDDASVQAQLLPPLAEHAGSCPAGWVPVLIGSEEMPEHTTEGSDWIDMAVVCPGGDRVAVTTMDM